VYTLTLTADSACLDLPQEARRRTYAATIARTGVSSSFLATLSDARFFSTAPCPFGPFGPSCTHNSFGLRLAGDYASVYVGFIEQLSETTHLVYSAGGAGSFGPAGITTPLEGYFLYCPTELFLIDQGTWWCRDGAACESDRHQLVLVRR
jgi:hypothetical protein